MQRAYLSVMQNGRSCFQAVDKLFLIIALAGQGANKGLFITTAQFTKEAWEYAKKQHTTKVVLVDGESLVKLMIDYNLGVSTQAVYQIKRLDSDFFSEDND